MFNRACKITRSIKVDLFTEFNENKINMVSDWYLVTITALQDLWQGILGFIPTLVVALAVFVFGWFVSYGLGRLVAEVLKKLNFNRLFEKGVWKGALEKAEIKVDAAEFIGAIFKWILVLVFLMASVEILGLPGFTNFLNDVLGYLPNVMVAVLIVVAAAILADILEKLVRAAIESIGVGYGHFAGTIVKWSIWGFAILAILRQLLIVPEFAETLFNATVYGLVAAVVIPFSIAFGLGGKDVAAEILRDLQRKLKS